MEQSGAEVIAGLEVVLASRWASPENRKREAVRAAHARDRTALAGLLEHHLHLESPRGASTSGETIRQYRTALGRFLNHCESHALEIARLERGDVKDWLVQLQVEGLSPRTVAQYLVGVRALYRALEWAGATREDPTAKVKPPRDPTPAHEKKGALSPALYAEVMAQPSKLRDPGNPQIARDELLIALGGSLGLRAMEICALELEDANLKLRRLTVRRGKGGKKHTVPITATVLERLEAWLKVRRGLALRGLVSPAERRLLVSVGGRSRGRGLTTNGARRIANAHFAAVGLPVALWGLHTLRRTAGTHLYRATKDLHVVSDVLGHASVATSAIYAKMDMDTRAEALEKMERMRKL